MANLPPGTQLTDVSVTQYMNPDNTPVKIEFTGTGNNELMQPLLQASFSNGNLNFNAVVFIDANADIPPSNISVYYNSIFTPPLFFINYNGIEAVTNTYYLYSIQFSLPMSPNPTVIQACVWDSDPTGSRGTTTTVQTT